MSFSQIRNILTFAVLVWAVVATKGCGYYKDDSNSQSDYNSILKDSLITYHTKEGKLIAEKDAALVSSNTFEKMAKENDKLKKQLKDAKIKAGNVVSVTSVASVTTLDTVFIDVSLPCDSDFVRHFSVDSTYYSLAGYITKEKLAIQRLIILDSLNITVAYKRPVWYKSKDLIVTTTHSNPLVITNGLSNIQVKDKPKALNSWLKFGIGVAAGIAIMKL